jgi:hypothetical protein
VVVSIRALSIALIWITVAVMAVHFIEYFRYALAAVNYRFEIFDAEGIVWQQAMLIPGPRMYGDINNYPFIVFHYPPLYHLLSRAVSLLGCTPLFAGRAISLASTLVSAAAISLLTWKIAGRETGRLAGLTGAAVSGLAFFCFFPIVLTSTVMRVDMLAIAFSFIGLLCFTTSGIHSWRPFAGMALFVLAVFTKQTSIAAPLAAMTVTALIAPGQCLKILGFGLVLGAIPLSILMWMTHGGFLRHLVLYNLNRYYLFLLWDQIGRMAPFHIIFISLAFGAIVLWWRRFLPSVRVGSLAAWRDALTRDDSVRAMVMLTLYLGVATVMLAALGKNGAGVSYFDEWVGILSILVGVLVATIAAPSAATGILGGVRMAPAFKLLLPVSLIVQVLSLPTKGKMDFFDEAQTRESDQLVDMIARADKPVLSTDMVMLMIAGKQVPWEPAIFAELSSLGRWDESHITRMIAAHDFAFIVTRSPNNLTPAVSDAVGAAYPRVKEIAQHTLHYAAE